MKTILTIVIAFMCATAFAQPYVQAGTSVFSSTTGAAASSGIDAGLTAGPMDSTVGIFQARQNTKYGDVHWSGVTAATSYNKPIYGPVTGFIGYQVAQTPDHSKTAWDGRYGLGLTLHAKPAKVSLVITPEQRAWDGSRAVKTIGLSVKIWGGL